MTNRLSVASAKARLSEVIRDVEADRGPVVIERRGRPVVVIQKYAAQVSAKDDWFTRLYGSLAEVDDFHRIMRGVVRSRSKAGTRSVDLEEDR
jgi:prevent-host-death family protein